MRCFISDGVTARQRRIDALGVRESPLTNGALGARREAARFWGGEERDHEVCAIVARSCGIVGLKECT